MKKVLQSITLLLAVLMFPAVANAQQTLYGDVNGDLEINIADINSVIDIILDGTAITPAADVNGDGEVNIADINVIIDIILGGGAHLSWYLVADQDRPISMSRVAVLTMQSWRMRAIIMTRQFARQDKAMIRSHYISSC